MAFKDVVNTVKSETKDAIDVTKLRSKVSKERASIKENYKKIGEYIFKNMRDELSDNEELEKSFASIEESFTRMEDYNSEINKIRMN